MRNKSIIWGICGNHKKIKSIHTIDFQLYIQLIFNYWWLNGSLMIHLLYYFTLCYVINIFYVWTTGDSQLFCLLTALCVSIFFYAHIFEHKLCKTHSSCPVQYKIVLFRAIIIKSINTSAKFASALGIDFVDIIINFN